MIPNSANIYFDFNAPIETNTATTTITPNLGTENFAFSDFNYFPNPVKNTLFLKNTKTINSIEITSLVGQTVLSKKVMDVKAEINLSDLANGIYFVKVKAAGHEKIVKIMKE